MRDGYVHGGRPGVVPLKNLGNLVVSAHDRGSRALVTIALVVVVGCVLVGPALLVLTLETSTPAWVGGLVGAVLLLGQMWWVWHEVRVVVRVFRGNEPKRLGEQVTGDRIDIAFADGTLRFLPLHAADLGFEVRTGSGWVPFEQHVLTATGPDGLPVRVLIANTPNRAQTLNAMGADRQPDPVLAAIAAVAERSPFQAGRETAAQIRYFIGTRMTSKGWRH